MKEFGTPGFFIVLIILTGCGTRMSTPPESFVTSNGVASFSADTFEICYDYGCNSTAIVNMSLPDWNLLATAFTPEPATPTEERACIAKAVQQFEILYGKKTGLTNDKGGTFSAILLAGQMDCVDEAVNTNICLLLMQEKNWLQFHSFYGIATRGGIIRGWPHVACVIKEKMSEKKFVVDSWFSDHGQDVHITEEALWLDGWKPE